jgi:hypothetical protein
MRRFVTALALIAAVPVLSACIIIASDKPETRVIHQSSAD